MSYSLGGYKLVCEMVIPHLISAIEGLVPGTAEKIINGIVAHTSEELEKKGGDDQALREALYIAADWEKITAKKETPKPNADQDREEPVLDTPPRVRDGRPLNRVLTDDEFAPALLEGQAAARLALMILWPILNKLDADYQNDGKEKFVAGGVFSTVVTEINRKAAAHAVYAEMQRLIREGFASNRHEWRSDKLQPKPHF